MRPLRPFFSAKSTDVLLFCLMFLYWLILSIGIVDSAPSVYIVVQVFNPLKSDNVKT